MIPTGDQMDVNGQFDLARYFASDMTSIGMESSVTISLMMVLMNGIS